MGEAILAALIRSGCCRPRELIACEAVDARRAEIRRRYRVKVTTCPAELAAGCETIVLAVKPQDLDAALLALAPSLARRHLLVSIAWRARRRGSCASCPTSRSPWARG